MAAREETKPLSNTIEEAIRQKLLNLHTAMPGTIESYDELTGLASVRPAFRRKYVGQSSPVDLPVIPNVPVGHMRMGSAWIKLPVKKGDTGFLIFSERAMDKWKALGGSVDPDDPRHHDLTDAVFLPVLSPKTSPMISEAGSRSVEIKNQLSRIEMLPDGKFKIGTNAVDALSLFNELLQSLIDALVITGIGPQKFSPSTLVQFELIKAKLDQIKGGS